MNKVVGITRNPWVLTSLLGFLLGTLFGLFALGWGLFPVVWVDAGPADLNASYKEDYLRASIGSFAHNQDVLVAQSRFQSLGETGPALLSQITNNPGNLTVDDIAKYAAIVMGNAPATSLTPGATTPATGGSGKSTITAMLTGLCLLMLIIGGALIYLLFFRNRAHRKKVEEEEPSQGYVYEESIESEPTDQTPVEQTAPFIQKTDVVQPFSMETPPPPDNTLVAQFMTSYNLGDDLYDDTFSIDASNGEFLGECGAGISDTIGMGDPKKISAFEVWLFDKNDIQTVTKVIMSSALYNDPSARQRLSIRGEPVLAEPGKVIKIDTATLRLDVRIQDMNYGQANLPAASFFDRMTMDLNIHQK